MPDILYTSGENLSRSEFDRREFSGQLPYQNYPHPNGGPKIASNGAKVTHKSKKTSRGIFKRKSKESLGGNYDREIAAASGEWVNEFIPNNGKKKTSAKLYVPSTAELLKRNIKRSWTISNPTGTTGPQITPRNDGAQELRPFPKNDLPILDEKRLASNRPVIVAQIPPPINRMSRPPHPGGAPPNQQVKRNVPVRSQSMGVADTSRFYMKPMPIGGPPPRFRPPPPPDERRPLVNRRIEYIETSSDGEDAIFDPIVPDYRSWDRRKTNYGNQGLTLNQKYKTLEPRSKSGGDSQSLERLNNSRRILPDVPSHSLPRPGKRTQSDSRSRDRQGVEAKRSQSHGDGIGEPSRRKLPPVPGKLDRDIREPTPDYDTSPPPSESSRLTGRRNSDSGLLAVGRTEQNHQVTVKRHASSVEKVGRRLLTSQSSPENNLDSDDSVNKGSGRSHRSQASQVSVGHQGSTGSPINKHLRLEQRLSSSSNNNSPPPVLPPKTRKLQQLPAAKTSKTSPNPPDQSPATPDSVEKQQTGTNSAAAAAGAPQSAQVRATSITKRQLGPSDKVDSHLQETFVDDGVSIVRIGQPAANLNRSASSVTQSRVKHTIAKPVRRSKSQLPGSKFVTNITHGGSVTLVSLNDELQSREFHPIDPDLTPGFVNRGPGLHSGRTVVSAFQGSNTLPRAGQKKKQAGSCTVDDSEIVITKKLTGGGSSVRIRIGGAARSPTEHIDVTKNWREPEISEACEEGVKNETVIGQDTLPNTNFSQLEKPLLTRLSSDSKVGDPAGGSASSTASGIQSNISGKSRQILPRSASVPQTPAKPQSFSSTNTKRQGGVATNKNRRKYTLDQIEVEDFRDSNSEEEKQSCFSELSDPEGEGDAEGVASDFDLNSLIEGDVDDDDFGEHFSATRQEAEESTTPVVTYFEPLKDPEASVDGVLSEAEFSEEELGSLAVNVGSLHHRSSDTEGDFLDKDEIRKNTLNRANQSGPGDDEYKSNMADDEYSLCSDMEQNRDKKTVKVDRDRTRAQKQSNDSDSDGPEHNGSKCANDKSSLLSSRSNHLQLPDCTTPNPDNSTPLHMAETTETSDFDSVSTTSASYVVSHSDMESLSLDDHQLDILMNKSDLSDLDQIDSKTITGSGSSDEEGAVISSNHSGSAQFAISEPFLTVGTEVPSHQNVDQAHFDPTRALPNQPTDQAMCEGQDPVSPRRSCQVSKAAPAHDNSSARPVGQENCEGVHTSDTKNSDHKNHVNLPGNSPSSTPAPPSHDPNLQLAPAAPAHKQTKHLSTTSDPLDSVKSSPKQEGKLKGSVGLSDFDRQGTPDVPRRKGSVSDLIAKFEISRSNTPERSITPESRSLRSATPEKTVKQADSVDSKQATPGVSQITEEEDKHTNKPEHATGARPKQLANRESKTRVEEQFRGQHSNEDFAESLSPGYPHSENLISNESERAELKGLKEFTQKYLKEQAAKNASKKSETKEPCKSDTLGAEGGVKPEEIDSDIEDIDMPPTIRRNSGGAYTSYVFISNEPSDEVASVVSSNGSYTDPENRVTVNVKETAVSPNTCVVAIQDGRTSNISIVSTESSELNSPRQSPTSLVDEPPELPTKVKVGIGKDHSELQQIVYATRESLRDYSHRSRGGEELDREFLDDEPEHERSGLANYFTSTLESSFISRRGRPPVIRAAEKVRRQQGNFEYEDESRGMMIDYSDHQPYRESSSTPVLDVDDDMVEEYEEEGKEKFKITEVPVDDYSPANSDHFDEYDPQVQYDIHYGSGESADEYIEREEYPMCQQVYDSEEYSYSEGEQISSGDEFDREEELRGYNRAIDFTLHTIIEESCEDSEPENRSLRAGDKKRHSDPSELEKYFFYGVGGGNIDQSVYEESEYSDTNSETNSLPNEQHIKAMKETVVDSAELASTRLEKYFMTGFSEEKQHSLDAISEQGNTDDSGSVGSESDGTGQPSPDQKRKKVTRPRGFRSERLSDRAESGTENNSNVEDESGNFNTRPHDMSYSSESGEDNTAFVSGDGSFDTIKRKKNKVRKPSDDRRSDSERSVDSRRSSAVSEVPFFKSTENSNDTVGVFESLSGNKKEDKSSPKISPPITPLPSQTIEAQISDPSLKKQISPSGSDKEPESMKPRGSGSSKESPSTSPPPVGGPVRKHKSRDSGFVGSNDDLLRNEGSHIIISSSDDMQSKNHTESSSEGEHENRKPRLEKVSEVSENTEDDCEKSIDSKASIVSQKESSRQSSESTPRKKSNESDISKDGSESSRLSRKDSFHQWSSDEETNIMMNRMRTFFKNMLVNASKGKPLEPTRKPTQIVYFEEQLTRLMKTVPGINDQQVKEIVEYLSSEDTWSDSYDSSDYTDYTSSDLEGAPFFNESEDSVIPDMDVEIPEQISASCQEMIQKFEGKNPQSGASNEPVGEQDEFQKETAIMYQKLMNSVAKMQQSQEEQKKENEAKRSPPIAAKILHHISSRLVTLMHEVSGSDNSSTASISDSRQNLYLTSKDFRNQSVTSSPKPKTGSRRHRQLEGVSSIDSIKSDRMSNSGHADDNRSTGENGRDKLTPLKTGEENENSYTFNSLDSPKVLMGPNLGTSPKTNPFKFTKNTSKSVEVLDLGRRRASLDDKSLKLSMAKSTSTDYDVWQGIHRDVDQRRGSLPRGQLESVQSHSSGSGVSEHFDDERFSWKGSFESALAADSRTRLSIEAKRRSIGSDCNSEIFSSVEQMDRSGSHTGSKSSLITSRSPSQSSKRSLKSSLPNSRSSLHISKSEKDITRNSEFSTTPTSELSTKLSTQDSDSDDASGSISSSVRSSISSRYGRRSSVPETTVLARLSEDSPPHSPPPRTIPSSATSITISGLPSTRQHSTNSLPRLGTSAIQKSKSTSTTLITSSTTSAPSQPSNIATSTQGGVRSARYRPHGYKPPPTRKMSPASGGPSRKSSADSIGRFNDDASEISSKSGTPSPLVSRVGMGVYPPGQNRSTSDLLRDFRESSVCSRASSGADTAEIDEKDGNEKFGSQLIKAGSLSSLGTRSESMASVYSQGEGRYGTVAVRGDVEFGFIYNFGSGSLDISIKQCKDLAPVDLKRNRSDPYVKVYLLPDRSKAGKRKTKVKKHTLNPIFEEILKFVMPLNEVERRTMWISVWHSDMFGRNDFLGEVMMPMTGQVFDDPSSKWYSLQDRTEPPEDESVINSKGDIIVALKYVPSEASPKHSKKKKGTLMILIKEAKNLPVPKGTTLPDPYCKCYLLPSQPSRGKQKTGICRRTTSPRWEQTICWDDLTIEDVSDRSLELAIWDHDRLGHQDFLGGARFNLGTGKHGGRPTTWMDATGKEVTLWQQMLDRPNFWVEGSISLRAALETIKPEK